MDAVKRRMAAGVATAGAVALTAVALTAVVPATQIETVAAPTVSHQVVLTGFEDFAKSLENLWGAVTKDGPEWAAVAHESATKDIVVAQAEGRVKPGGTVIVVTNDDSTGGFAKDVSPTSERGAQAASFVDKFTALQTAGAGYRNVVEGALWGVANEVDPVAASLVGAHMDVGNALDMVNLRTNLQVAEGVHQAVAAAEKGDVKGVVNSVADTRLRLRDNLASYESDGSLNKTSSLGQLRGAANKARDDVAKEVIKKLPTGLQSTANSVKAGADKARDSVRKTADKVGSAVKKAADSVTKKVKDATKP